VSETSRQQDIRLLPIVAIVLATTAFVVLLSMDLSSANTIQRGQASVVDDQPGAAASAAAPPSGGVDSQAVLRKLQAQDSQEVEDLVGQWVPQLSAKKPGLAAQGRVFSAADVLADHEALRDNYPGALLIWSGNFASYRNKDYWITVMKQPFTNAADANAWCDAQDIGPDDCFAKRLMHKGDSSGTTVYRR